MAFYWDPTNEENDKQQLRLRYNAGEEEDVEILFPPQLWPAPDCSPHLPHLKAEDHPD